jgi:predicted SprT family Zn-dependent metalloprotease
MTPDHRTRALELARDLLNEHGLGRWSIRVNTRMSRTLGRCDHHTRTIQLARWVFERCPWEEIEDLVRHEVAHALAGPRAGHGPRWKTLAVQLGARPTACTRPEGWTSPSQDRPRNIRLECLACGFVYPRKNRVRVERFRCSRCGGELRQYKVA